MWLGRITKKDNILRTHFKSTCDFKNIISRKIIMMLGCVVCLYFESFCFWNKDILLGKRIYASIMKLECRIIRSIIILVLSIHRYDDLLENPL